MRRIFQIDGVDSGLLSVGESKLVDRVVLCIQSGDQEAHLMLNRETFKQLCGLWNTNSNSYGSLRHRNPKQRNSSCRLFSRKGTG